MGENCVMKRFRNVTPNIIFGNTKSRKRRRVEHVDPVKEKRNARMFLLGNLKEGDCLEDLRVDWMLILKLSLKTQDERTYAGSIWLRTATCRGLFSA
jgi:hypothetical protein